MTEETVISPDTVTDAQVDEFFKNEGAFDEKDDSKAGEPAEPSKTEDADDEPAKAEEEKPKEEKKVNLGALHEERARRKAEKEAREAAERERDELRVMLAQYKRPAAEVDDDPIESIRRDNEQVKQVLVAQAQVALQQKQEAEYWSRVRESEQAFKQDVPDFDDAIKFLADSRLDELKDLGWSDQEAQKVLQDEIKWISDKAYNDEVNPAERFYALAKRRGFSKAVEPAKSNEGDAKIESIKKGQELNKNLPLGSKTSKQDLTAEALADMPVDALSSLQGQTEFDKAWKKLFG